MRRAFTVIELLVSVTLGTVICATAFAAVRTASTSFAIGTRLSVENQLMRDGVYAALDELDTWRWYDDPAPSGDRPLRTSPNPFCPVQLAADFNFECLPVRGSIASDPNYDYETWWRHDSRAWWRGDPTFEGTWQSGKVMGDFALYGTIAYTDGSLLQGEERRWYNRLVHDTAYGLGYYAMVDVSPPSLMCSYMDQNGIVPNEFCETNAAGGPGSVSTSWWDDRPHDFVSLTLGGLYTIGVPSRATDPRYQTSQLNRSLFLTWLADGGATPNPGWTADDAINSLPASVDTLPLRPSGWPAMSVSVRHYIANSRSFHGATVIAKSPVTGQTFKLRFTHTATTLRGARRSRNLDANYPGGTP